MSFTFCLLPPCESFDVGFYNAHYQQPHSQGGQLVHNAASSLSAQDTAFVSSAVIFGDPDNGKAVGKVSSASTKVICHQGDLICAGQSIILVPHLTYGQDANTAAQFVVNNMKAAGTAGIGTGVAAKAVGKATRALKFTS
jgi:cutinase